MNISLTLINFKDFMNPICDWGQRIESIQHICIHYLFYNDEGIELSNNLFKLHLAIKEFDI